MLAVLYKGLKQLQLYDTIRHDTILCI